MDNESCLVYFLVHLASLLVFNLVRWFSSLVHVQLLKVSHDGADPESADGTANGTTPAHQVTKLAFGGGRAETS